MSAPSSSLRLRYKEGQLSNPPPLSLPRYEAGQFYREHHDQNSPRLSAWGPRLYTFFMYLSDVEEARPPLFPLAPPPGTPSTSRW
jgi:hypothetical protein